ncbi:MAG: MFS transporter [Alphaproteobacteria bacterium]
MITVAVSLGLVLGQLAIMAVPALAMELSGIWHLDASEIGWLGGIYFAGYAMALPFLPGLTNRFDDRAVYAAAALTGAGAALGMALFADGFWSALVFRAIAGMGFSGIHIIGMKMLADRLAGDGQARASAFYTGAFALGSGCSYLLAGYLSTAFGWEAVFFAICLGSLCAIPALLLIGPSPDGHIPASKGHLADFAAVLRDGETVRYIIAYAGNLWEVFAIRVWFVPFLAFNFASNAAPNADLGLDMQPTTFAALSVLIAVPLNILIAEIGIRHGRRLAIGVVSLASVVVCVALGWQAAGAYGLVLVLLLLHGVTSYGDVGAIAGGFAAATRRETRAAALSLLGMAGFAFGFLGPLAVGLAIQQGGGRDQPTAWLWGFAVMALGSVVSGLAMLWRGKS